MVTDRIGQLTSKEVRIISKKHPTYNECRLEYIFQIKKHSAKQVKTSQEIIFHLRETTFTARIQIIAQGSI